MLRLIADNRERAVTPHLKIDYAAEQMTTGDYAVAVRDQDGRAERILAVFERKSLTDFGASIRDGRHENKAKLLALRETTGCAVIYIVEGPAFPSGTTKYGGIPYSTIESSIFHLMVRDNITVMRTRNEEDTAGALARFVASMSRLITGDPAILERYRPVEREGGAEAALTAPQDKPAQRVLLDMWRTFPRVAAVSAPPLAAALTLRGVILREVDRAALDAITLPNGRKLQEDAMTALLTPQPGLWPKLLACVPGISAACAKELLAAATLPDLLRMTPETLADCKKTPAGRRVGPKAAESILRYFGAKLGDLA